MHEAFLRLPPPSDGEWERRELLALASNAIRRVLIDHARARMREKRGGGVRRLTLCDDEHELAPTGEVDLLLLDDSLERLRRRSERSFRVVELRFFGGMQGCEIARALGVSPRTVDTEWRFARAWLRRDIEERRSP